jgi:hypothetical protein
MDLSGRGCPLLGANSGPDKWKSPPRLNRRQLRFCRHINYPTPAGRTSLEHCFAGIDFIATIPTLTEPHSRPKHRPTAIYYLQAR